MSIQLQKLNLNYKNLFNTDPVKNSVKFLDGKDLFNLSRVVYKDLFDKINHNETFWEERCKEEFPGIQIINGHTWQYTYGFNKSIYFRIFESCENSFINFSRRVTYTVINNVGISIPLISRFFFAEVCNCIIDVNPTTIKIINYTIDRFVISQILCDIKIIISSNDQWNDHIDRQNIIADILAFIISNENFDKATCGLLSFIFSMNFKNICLKKLKDLINPTIYQNNPAQIAIIEIMSFFSSLFMIILIPGIFNTGSTDNPSNDFFKGVFQNVLLFGSCISILEAIEITKLSLFNFAYAKSNQFRHSIAQKIGSLNIVKHFYARTTIKIKNFLKRNPHRLT